MKSNIPYISVIIPVFNSECYLDACVQSVLSQLFTDYEVVLVDDGSSDSSPLMCDEYAKSDSRFKVIHKLNAGAADSRNIGLMLAKGRYVIFMDSDDFWKNDGCFQTLVDETLKTPECDFIGFNIEYYWNNGHTKRMVSYSDSIVNELDKELLIQKLVKTGSFPISPCSKIIKRSLLVGSEIMFPKGLVCEDILWFQYLLEKATCFRCVNEYLYCYRKGIANSVTGSMTVEKYDNFFYVLRESINHISVSNYGNVTKDALLSFCAYNFCILLGEIGYLDFNSKAIRIKELKKYKWLLHYDLNYKVRKTKVFFRILGFRLTSFLLYIYISKYLR